MDLKGNICVIGSNSVINIQTKRAFIREGLSNDKICLMLCNKLEINEESVIFCNTYEQFKNYASHSFNEGFYLFFNYKWIKNKKEYIDELKDMICEIITNKNCKVLSYFSMKNLDVDFLKEVSYKFDTMLFESSQKKQIIPMREISNINFLIKSIQTASKDNLKLKRNQRNLQILNDAIINFSFESNLENAIKSALKIVLQITHAVHGSITVVLKNNKIEELYGKPRKVDKTYSYRIYSIGEIVGILTLGYKEGSKNEEEDDYIINIICESLGDMVHTFREREDGMILKKRGDKIKLTGEIAGGIVHDLNNIFSIIKGYTQLLQINKEAGNISEYVRIIYESTQEAIDKVKTIQDFSRNIKDKERYLVVNDVIEKVIEAIRPKWENIGYISGNNINIVSNLNSKQNIFIQESSLREAIMNIILNSIDSLNSCGGTIWVNSYDKEKSVIIEIIDDGKGIPSDIMDKIFDPFFTTKGKGKSTGLGLSIVKKNVEHNGGNIDVFSGAEGLTKFIIKLPTKNNLNKLERN